MQTATATRRRTAARLRACQIPPAFAAATISAAAAGKGTRNDQRRRQSHALKLAEVVACQHCGTVDAHHYEYVDGSWLCCDCADAERDTLPDATADAGATVPAPVSIVTADSAAALEAEVDRMPVPKFAGLQTIGTQAEEQRLERFLAGTRGAR